MTRIRLSIPKNIHFTTQLSLRIYDLNYGAHMGNDSVLSIVHEARVRFLNYIDQKESDFYGFSLLMADSAVVYKKEAFYGEKLKIDITVTEYYKFGFELFYLISNVAASEIARVKTGLVCYDHSEKKMIRLPDEFLNKFK